ncbi:MAG: WG repeat-containing protein, partial [Bacteroidia bacterium]
SPESKTCFFIDTFGNELPIGKHAKLKIADKFSEGLICINFKKQDWQPEAWGCLNAKGDTLIKGAFLESFIFNCGVAKVVVSAMPTRISNEDEEPEYHCQYINTQGVLINEKVFENNTSSLMANNWAVAKWGAKWFIISKYGLLKELSVDYESVDPFSDGMAKCKRMNGYTAYIDTTRWSVLELPNENYFGDFHNGFAAYSTTKDKYGFINKKGQPVTTCIYEAVSFFNEDLVAIKMYKKWGYADAKGKLIISPNYEATGGFKEGLAWVMVNGKYGFIDKNDLVVVPIKYTQVLNFENGMAAVCDDKNLWGFINKKGDWVIKPQFIGAENFDKWGYARVLYADKHSYKKGTLEHYEKALLNKRGNVIWYSGEKLILK